MAQGEHRAISFAQGDTVIISATPIPGNETKVSRVINNLVRRGVVVHHGRNASVHVSGHAAQDELRTLYNVVDPQALIPVHGEYVHLHANAAVGRSVGIEEIVVCEDGDRIVLDKGKLTYHRGAVPAGYVYIDGLGIGDVEDVLRDRRHLADDGVLIVTVGIEMGTGKLVIGPDVDSHGLTDDTDVIHGQVVKAVGDALGDMELPLDPDGVRRKIRSAAGRVVKRNLDRRPVIFPIVIEV
jgi:ribonuclease J